MGPPRPATPLAAHAWVAEPPEAEVVTRLMLEFRDWHGRDWPSEDGFRASVKRLMAHPDAEFLLASPDEDAPADGVSQVRYRHSIWTAADDCWLEDLYVREAARGRGLGEALVRLAVEQAQRRGCRRVELDVNERNQPALALYLRLGFQVSRKPPGGHDVLMRLRIGE